MCVGAEMWCTIAHSRNYVDTHLFQVRNILHLPKNWTKIKTLSSESMLCRGYFGMIFPTRIFWGSNMYNLKVFLVQQASNVLKKLKMRLVQYRFSLRSCEKTQNTRQHSNRSIITFAATRILQCRIFFVRTPPEVVTTPRSVQWRTRTVAACRNWICSHADDASGRTMFRKSRTERALTRRTCLLRYYFIDSNSAW